MVSELHICASRARETYAAGALDDAEPDELEEPGAGVELPLVDPEVVEEGAVVLGLEADPVSEGVEVSMGVEVRVTPCCDASRSAYSP